MPVMQNWCRSEDAREPTTMPKTKTKQLRDAAKYRVLPPLDAETYAGLRANIAVNGVQVPVVIDERGYILDGFARARIARELGYECPSVVAKGLTEQEKRSAVRALNLARRHLDYAARRQVIADELKENPDRSNRWIARSLGVHHDTVIAVRHELTSTGQVSQSNRLTGQDGRVRPAFGTIPSSNGKAHGAVLDKPQEHNLDEEEEILRAAAQIRQRRVAARLKEIQEKRRQSRPPVRLKKRGGPVLHGDCLDLIPTLVDGSISLVVTSPPYAEQRAGHYQSVTEEDYPDFTVQWMDAVRPKLTQDGSVLVIIRPHLRGGVLSDYVLRTRLAVREAGWHECEELIWHKPDAPPLGSKLRPRRAWESILWFSRSRQPYVDLKACGRESDRLGFNGAIRFAEDGISEKTAWHPCVESFGKGRGIARISDVVVANVAGNEPGLDHPAVFPLGLAEQLIKTFSQPGDLVLDCFAGSAQTLLAAKGCGRRYLGIEREERYVKIALGRLK
jgi:site-specific DNA-methyltransferase (adenine-specific)/site-specific DNA-methyltransferase (cytosine-N4-specific)